MTAAEDDNAVKVLFVDDEDSILRSLRRLFLEEDFDVLTAASGERGLEVVRKHVADLGLIVSDQRMPGLTGAEFLEQVREIAPDALRVMLTGYADVNAAMDAINRGGAARFITKPWNDAELVQSIREAVALFRLKRENKRMAGIIRQQNEELAKWNEQLEDKVREQTGDIKRKNIQLKLLNQQLKRSFDNSIAAFAGLLELRDPTVRNHSNRVAEVSLRIAKGLQLSAEDIENINLAAMLHDIGKIGIKDELLRKEMHEMEPAELEEYKQHPVRGQAAIDSIKDLREAGVLIRHHHEWFNGEGFPDGLRGEEIPLGARIVGMADYLDRQAGSNPDKETLEQGLELVQAELGGRLDPQLYPLLKEPLAEIYLGTLPRGEIVETEIMDLAMLHTGMVVSRDVVSGTGLLLLGKGKKLTEHDIQSLKRYYELDPPEQGVFVWTTKR